MTPLLRLVEPLQTAFSMVSVSNYVFIALYMIYKAILWPP